MKRLIPVAVLIGLAGCNEGPAFPGGRIVDLTHGFDGETVYWPTGDGFERETLTEGLTERGYFYAAGRFCAPEHGGTHIDAPYHFHDGRQTVDEIPVDRLIGPGVVVDVAEACARDRDYRVTIADFEAWEELNGPLPQGAIVLLRTGFGSFWPDRVAYMGTDERGAEAVPKLHFPGLHPQAADWLIAQRSIDAVGLDTPSIDHGPSVRFDSHVRLARDNTLILENVAHLAELPARGFTVIALPMKIRGGTGSPARIIAVLD